MAWEPAGRSGREGLSVLGKRPPGARTRQDPDPAHSLPALPTLPTLPALPALPTLPTLPALHALPTLPAPHGQDLYFSLPSLYQKQMEVFAQACSFPNKQTQVNCGVEQGLGLPAILSPWAWVAAGDRDRVAEGRAPFPIFSSALPKRFCIAQPPGSAGCVLPAPRSSLARSHNANSSAAAQLVCSESAGLLPTTVMPM